MEKNQENSANFLLDLNEREVDPWIIFDESRILLGDIYWTSPRGKRMLLHRCSSLISKEKRCRINNNRNQFEFVLQIDEAYYRQTKNLLGQFASRSRDIHNRLEQQKQSREEIFNNILPAFWFGQEKRNLLDVVLAWNEQMFHLPVEIESQLVEKQELLYKRSMFIGWCLCIYAMMLGYNDYYFIKDLYNMVFLMDYSMVETGLSTLDLDQLEVDALKWDNGHHALESFQLAQKYKENFKYKSVLRLIALHHETITGEGPKKINSAGMLDLEAILAHLNRVVSYKNDPFEKYEGKGILANLIEEQSKGLKGKTLNSIEQALKKFEMEDDDYLAVGGL